MKTTNAKAMYAEANMKKCPFTSVGCKKIDYKDVATLRLFVTERGRILPRRITGVSSFYQRKLSKAIKRARYMNLMPFVDPEGKL